MRLRRVGFTLLAALLAGGTLAACGGDSGGPSGPAPDLAGTWTMVNLNIVGTNVPGATGTFVFTADSLDITVVNVALRSSGLGEYDVDFTYDNLSIALDVPGQGSFGGAGTYTLTARKITVDTDAPLIGQATGSYTLRSSDVVEDTLYANLIAQGQQVSVAVTRP